MGTEIYQLKLDAFYTNNQDQLEGAWEDYISEGEWGSGEDKINITDGMFWEFVEDCMNEWEV